MAIIVICDGCDAQAPDMQERGIVHKKQFCRTCSTVADEYFAAFDVLHDKIGVKFQKDVARLKRDFFKAHPDFNLPDHVDAA